MIALVLMGCADVARPAAPPGTPASPLPTGTGVRVVGEDPARSGGGVLLRQIRWEAGGERGVAWLAGVARDGALKVIPSEQVTPLTNLVEGQAGSWAAINGGFYENGPMGLVVSDGRELNPRSDRGGSGIVTGGLGPVSILHRDSWVAGPPEALQSIDRIVDAGASLVKPRQNAHRDARSAMAISDDALWLVAAAADASLEPRADGAQLIGTAGRGLTLAEFADLLVLVPGARQALNLDGAVSTQMVVQIPDGRWIWSGERGTINGLVVRPP